MRGGFVIVQSCLTIEVVANRLGITPRTLHYYEEIHLIEPVARTSGGHRLYDERTIERLEQILRLKENLGYSLQEIKRIIDIENALELLKISYSDEDASCEDRLGIVDETITLLQELSSRIDTRIDKLQSMKSHVSQRLNRALAIKERHPATSKE